MHDAGFFAACKGETAPGYPCDGGGLSGFGRRDVLHLVFILGWARWQDVGCVTVHGFDGDWDWL